MTRFSPTAGIAIGPILFVLALLGLLAAVASSGTGFYGQTGTTDRVAADIVSQANLIRSKINECNTLYGTNNNGDGWPDSTPAGNPVLVSDLECEGDPTGQKNLWSGLRVAMMPQPTAGFGQWNYINADTGGRCIWIIATGGKTNSGLVEGLKKAAEKFSSQEVSYDSTKTDQKFVVFITRPTAATDAHCTTD